MSSPLLTTPPAPNTLPPLLGLASELHLTILSFLSDLKDAKDENDLALLQLRRTNRYFRNLVPPPTHDDLLRLEFVLYKYSVYACKFCLCLRREKKFASTMLKGKKGIGGQFRDRRFCADCGFDTTVVGSSQRYCPNSRACVDGVDWVWCRECKFVKKGEEATSVCVGLCKECYKTLGCRCGVKCGKRLKSTTPLDSRTLIPLRWVPAAASSRRIRYSASDTDSDGDDQTDEYDYWEEQFELAQAEDNDWRALD